MIRVSIVVVTFNSEEHIERCLTALCAMEAEPDFEVIVSDNQSKDRTAVLVEQFVREFPGRVRLQANTANRGYAGGVNAALPMAAGEFIGVLNPDIVVEPDWLRPLVAFLDSHPGAAAVNPLILLSDQPGRINAAGQEIHVSGLGFNRWLGRPRSCADCREAIPVSGIQGGAFVVRRSLLDMMGGWDESGFLYHEDVEISWLLRLMGYDLFCIPRSSVRHAYRLTMYPEKLYLLERNRWSLLRTHLRPASRLFLAPFLFFTEMLMWTYCVIRGPRFLLAKAAAIRWVLGRRRPLGERRTAVQALRRRSDREVLSRLAWRYAWSQFVTLGRERGLSERRPEGGMPAEHRRPL